MKPSCDDVVYLRHRIAELITENHQLRIDCDTKLAASKAALEEMSNSIDKYFERKTQYLKRDIYSNIMRYIELARDNEDDH